MECPRSVVVVISALLFVVLFSRSGQLGSRAVERSFVIDADCECFKKDGQPFRYVSGSLHYFRVPRASWKDRMSKMRLAGLNAIQTYVEWSSHEPEEPGSFDFEGNLDLQAFLETAVEQDLLVILRPGPYICAERDFGGLPFWLLAADSRPRSHDPVFLRHVDRWFGVLLPKVEPYLYENGGPVVWVQVENEYGQIGVCDFEYMVHLRALIRKHLGPDVLLFRTDIPGADYYACDDVDDVYVTADFGPGADVRAAFDTVRLFREHGPFVVTEFYPGWMDHWGQPHADVPSDRVCATLDQVLSLNNATCVNLYMFHGGTNFGFTNGANEEAAAGSSSSYSAQPTSYDYGAPLSEAGDPRDSYFEIRRVIGKYLPLPAGPLPEPSPKFRLGPLRMRLLSPLAGPALARLGSNPVYSLYPKTFEELNQARGFVAYSTVVDFVPPQPASLSIPGLRDRAYVYVDGQLRGVLARESGIFDTPLVVHRTQVLTLVVENSGRVNSGARLDQRKGIASNVTLGRKVLRNWLNSPLDRLDSFVGRLSAARNSSSRAGGVPGFYHVDFTIPPPPPHPSVSDGSAVPLPDTFLDPSGWRKGVAFVNGFNLGRYWPVTGPQVTLYLPGHLLNPYPRTNALVLLELERAPCEDSASTASCSVSLVTEPILDGPVPAAGYSR